MPKPATLGSEELLGYGLRPTESLTAWEARVNLPGEISETPFDGRGVTAHVRPDAESPRFSAANVLPGKLDARAAVGEQTSLESWLWRDSVASEQPACLQRQEPFCGMRDFFAPRPPRPVTPEVIDPQREYGLEYRPASATRICLHHVAAPNRHRFSNLHRAAACCIRLSRFRSPPTALRCGAFVEPGWVQPVANGGQLVCGQNAHTRAKLLPTVATDCDAEPMVRRGSTVRVR